MEAGTLHRTSAATRRTTAIQRLVTETKASIKTSEFWLIIAVIVGILTAAAVIKGGDSGGTDEFISSSGMALRGDPGRRICNRSRPRQVGQQRAVLR